MASTLQPERVFNQNGGGPTAKCSRDQEKRPRAGPEKCQKKRGNQGDNNRRSLTGERSPDDEMHSASHVEEPEQAQASQAND